MRVIPRCTSARPSGSREQARQNPGAANGGTTTGTLTIRNFLISLISINVGMGKLVLGLPCRTELFPQRGIETIGRP